MAVTIKYNGLNPFGTRTPLVSTEVVFQDNNGYTSQVDRYTLSGSRPRPSCNATFADYKADIDYLLSVFHLNFRKFEVIENGTTVFTFPQAEVKSVNFPEEGFHSFYRYEITIDCIRSYQNLGILDPQETIETSQEDSYIKTIRHSISCRGVGPNAVSNAVAFLDSRRVSVLPSTFQSVDGALIFPAVLSKNYNVNRLTGEVSLTTVYLDGHSDIIQLQTFYEDDVLTFYGDNVYLYNANTSSTLTYTSELSETADGTTISFSGNFQGNAINQNNEMQRAKQRFDLIDWQALAQVEWQKWGESSILGKPATFTVNQNPLTGQVDFVLTWNSNNQRGAYLQENSKVSINYDGGITCFTYTGTIKSDWGCAAQRFADVTALFNSTDFNARARSLWAEYGNGQTLSWLPKSLSKSQSKFSGSMSYEMTFCQDSGVGCGCAENMIYNLSFVEDIKQYAAQPILRGLGKYYIQDLGFRNRKRFSVDGSARTSKCCTVEQAKSNIKTRINFICAQYFPFGDKILEAAQIEASESGDTISFGYSWSAASNKGNEPDFSYGYLITDLLEYVEMDTGELVIMDMPF